MFKWLTVFLYVGFIFSTLSAVPGVWNDLSAKYGRMPKYALYCVFAISLTICLYRMIWRVKKRYMSHYILFTAAILGYAYLFWSLFKLPVEQVHLMEYGFLSYLVYLAAKNGNLLKTYIKVFLLVASIGYIDELIQFFLPDRRYDIKDVLVNALSGLLGIFLIHSLGIGAKSES